MWQFIFPNAAVRYRAMRSLVLLPEEEAFPFISTDCINVMNLSDMERERLIDAEWQHDDASNGGNGLYRAEVKIYGNNRTGLLVDITKVFTEKGIDINAIHSKTSKQDIATIDVSFSTKGREELTSVIEKLRQIESVIDIERTTG